jgi:hypothetical protein
MDLIAPPRDGIREKELSELGIEAEVRWDEKQLATVVLRLDALDRLIAGPDHECPDRSDEIDDAYTNGYEDALNDVRKLTKAAS